MITRRSSAVWEGDLKGGKGSMALGSGAFQGAYSFGTRFGDEPGTNPDELIAAAHAGCFSMALSGALAEAGYTPKRISTEAAVRLEKTDGGFVITRIDLTTVAVVPGIDEETFEKHAEAAKDGCPVSKALSAVDMTLEAELRNA
ncbi:MAG: OsmC family protein [Anaerolineae bacterium]